MLVFAVVTQVQFNNISNDKIYNARIDTYNSDVKAYDTAVKANEDCITSIEVRETYREIFGGVSILFRKVAELPASLIPLSPEAITYREELTDGIEEYIETPVEDGLPPKKVEDCPQKPANKPVKPKK